MVPDPLKGILNIPDMIVEKVQNQWNLIDQWNLERWSRAYDDIFWISAKSNVRSLSSDSFKNDE